MILNYLENWAALSGNALKQGVRQDLDNNTHDLRRYVMAVLDPTVTYGVKGKLTGGLGTLGFDENAYNILDYLASRKLTGNAAKIILEGFCEFHTSEAVELMNRALNKDLRCGVGIALINDLKIPGFKIPVFECQLAQPGEAKRMKEGEEWLGCIKYDGMRTLIEVNDNRVNFWTRSGKPIPALESLAPQVLEVFGGRSLMLDSEGVGRTFLDTVSQLRRKDGAALTDETVLQVFDMVDLDDFRNADNKTYFGGALTERLDRLSDFFSNTVVPLAVQYVNHEPVANWDEAVEMADFWMERGLEGGIFKRASAGYIKRRTHDWLKIKLEDEITAKVVAVYEGEKGKQFEGMLGGVTVEIDGVRSDIGGGWTPVQRAKIWAAETNRVVSSEQPSIGAESVAGVVFFPEPENKVIGRLIDIKSNGKNPSGALRHARFERFRDVGGEIA